MIALRAFVMRSSFRQVPDVDRGPRPNTDGRPAVLTGGFTDISVCPRFCRSGLLAAPDPLITVREALSESALVAMLAQELAP